MNTPQERLAVIHSQMSRIETQLKILQSVMEQLEHDRAEMWTEIKRNTAEIGLLRDEQ